MMPSTVVLSTAAILSANDFMTSVSGTPTGGYIAVTVQAIWLFPFLTWSNEKA